MLNTQFIQFKKFLLFDESTVLNTNCTIAITKNINTAAINLFINFLVDFFCFCSSPCITAFVKSIIPITINTTGVNNLARLYNVLVIFGNRAGTLSNPHIFIMLSSEKPAAFAPLILIKNINEANNM